jgi:hypothetical protein
LAIHDLVPAMAEGREKGEEEKAVTMHNFRDLYVVTEFMDGGDLSQLTCVGNKPPPLPPDEQRVKAVAFGLLSGLRVIHAARVLHRDLRPKNLLLSGDTVKVRVRVCACARVRVRWCVCGGACAVVRVRWCVCGGVCACAVVRVRYLTRGADSGFWDGQGQDQEAGGGAEQDEAQSHGVRQQPLLHRARGPPAQ